MLIQRLTVADQLAESAEENQKSTKYLNVAGFPINAQPLCVWQEKSLSKAKGKNGGVYSPQTDTD